VNHAAQHGINSLVVTDHEGRVLKGGGQGGAASVASGKATRAGAAVPQEGAKVIPIPPESLTKVAPG